MSDTINIEVVPDESGLPVNELQLILQGPDLEKAVTYLKSEYEKASTEMEGRNKKVIKWRQAMEALASDAPKTTPMRGSSNITVPLTQTLTQNLLAKVKGTFDARDPFWTVDSELPDEQTIKRNKVIQKYLNILASSPTDLDLEEVKKDLFGEAVLVGGCFPKVIWNTERWRVVDPVAGEREVVMHDGPQIIVIPVERCKYRRGIGKISRLPWISLDTPMTEYEIRQMAAHGEIDAEAAGKVLREVRTSPTDTESQRQKAEWFDEAEQTGQYDITEFWFYWDIDGSGVPVDLFFTVHVPSGTVLRQQYNTLGKRFVVPAKYIHRPFTLTGRGTGQMTEAMNDEATNVHNLGNDNMKIANMRMFVTKRTGGFQKDIEFYPGKNIVVDNPREDIVGLPIGEIYPSIGQAESKSWAIAQRAIGLSDNQMGFADQTLGSRDTARGQAMRLQQGDSILGSVIEGLKSTWSELGMLVWMQLVANKERVMDKERKAMRLSEDELQLLEEALNMELTDVPMRLSFTVRTTDAEKTFEQQRQNWMALTQIFTQFATQTVPLAMQLYGPQGQQMLSQAPELFKYMERVMLGSGKLMEDVFKFFGVKDTQEYIPDQTMMDQLLDTLGSIGQTFAGAGALGGMAGPSALGGGGAPALPGPGGAAPPGSPAGGGAEILPSPQGAAGAGGPASLPL